jgi:2-C-methyl-D-erythritol 2,4-cyclodiphosphate synthase
MFAGLGYDVHRFKKGRPLVLGGVNIPYKQGLEGHSDADVLVHAIMDALLGAAGLPDIGHFFPNSTEKYKNISSIVLLKEVFIALKGKKFKILNIDTSLIAEKPMIYPHIQEMKEKIAATLKLPTSRVGVKATTNEGLGSIGRGEGIAAFAVASVRKNA